MFSTCFAASTLPSAIFMVAMLIQACTLLSMGCKRANLPQSHRCHCQTPVDRLQTVVTVCLASVCPELIAGAFQVGKITFGKLREIEGASGSTAASEAKATAAEGPAEEIADEEALITEAPGKAAKVHQSVPQ